MPEFEVIIIEDNKFLDFTDISHQWIADNAEKSSIPPLNNNEAIPISHQ